ncbi:MAG TPA: type II toxin-antitoxin system VapC family toxin [Tepidisphaeraceae bacterium]|nr:type II toxin-antitoxin system VapC family toxin [Tepidisphaeraceae bacterium]
MSEWVFDASVTLAWCFDDERTANSDALFDRLKSRIPAIVPQIWPMEVTNVLALAGRKGRITVAERRQFLSMLESASVTVDAPSMATIFNDVLAIAQSHRLTAYDASYLELAMRLGLPLATLDKDLHKAARAAGLRLL